MKLKLKLQSLLVIGALGVVGASEIASAQTADSWRFSLTARVQWLFINHDDFVEEFRAAFYGGTIEVAPPMTPNIDFLVTGLTGRDSSGRADFPGGTIKRSRQDIEALVRYRLQQSPIAIFAGFRYVSFNQRRTAPSPFTYVETGTNLFDQTNRFYLAEIGVSFAVPIDQSAQHSVFGGATLGIGATTANLKNAQGGFRNDINGTAFVGTLDVNVGYSYFPVPWLGFQGRYRALMFPNGDNINRVFGKFGIAHGPEIGMTFRFGL